MALSHCHVIVIGAGIGGLTVARTLLEQCHGLGKPAYRVIGAGLYSDPGAMMLSSP